MFHSYPRRIRIATRSHPSPPDAPAFPPSAAKMDHCTVSCWRGGAAASVRNPKGGTICRWHRGSTLVFETLTIREVREKISREQVLK